MELPAALRQAVDERLSGVPVRDLANASSSLSARYRAEIRDGRRHLDDEPATLAYLAARLPATYAAIRSAMGHVAEQWPDFAPCRMLDAGSGPGTALWAAADCWRGLEMAVALEGSASIRQTGEAMAKALPFSSEWRDADLGTSLRESATFDLVVLAYVLDELEEGARSPLIGRLWALTNDLLLIVEPGTPAGWRRILAARQVLLEEGAILVAPCPHHAVCPVESPDWCHFSRRVARSRIHLRAKGADVPWEDEKFIYLAASPRPMPETAMKRAGARIIAPPHIGGGKAHLKLCQADGTAEERLVTKRDRDTFRVARRCDWGDCIAGLQTE